MSKYIEKNLLSNESLSYQTKRHWIIFILPLFFSIAAVFFLMQKDLLILLGYLLSIVSVVLWLNALTTYITSEFGVTNKRVLVKVGFIQRKSWETLLQKVAGIEVNQSILGRMLGFGTIIVISTGGAKDKFDGINNPLLLRKKVQEQIESTPQEHAS